MYLFTLVLVYKKMASLFALLIMHKNGRSWERETNESDSVEREKRASNARRVRDNERERDTRTPSSRRLGVRERRRRTRGADARAITLSARRSGMGNIERKRDISSGSVGCGCYLIKILHVFNIYFFSVYFHLFSYTKLLYLVYL